MSNPTRKTRHRFWLSTATAFALVTTLCACASDDVSEMERHNRTARYHGDGPSDGVRWTSESDMGRDRIVESSTQHPIDDPDAVITADDFRDAEAATVPSVRSETAPAPAPRERESRHRWVDHPSARGASPYPAPEWDVGHGSTGELRLDGRTSLTPLTTSDDPASSYAPLPPTYRSWNQPVMTTTNVELYRAMVNDHLERTDSCVVAIGGLDSWSTSVEEALWLAKCAEIHRLRDQVERRFGEYESADLDERPQARAALDRALVRLDRAVEPVYVEYWVLTGDPDADLVGPFEYRPWAERAVAGSPYHGAEPYDLAVDRHLRSVDSHLDVLDSQIDEETGAERDLWLETRAELDDLRLDVERAYGRLQAASSELWDGARTELDDALTALDDGLATAFAGDHLERDPTTGTSITAEFDGFESLDSDAGFEDRAEYEARLERDLADLQERIDRMEQRDEFVSPRARAYWRTDLRTARIRRAELERQLSRLEATGDESVWTSLRDDIDAALATTSNWTEARWEEFTAWAADTWDATKREWREVVGDDYEGWDADELEGLAFEDRDRLADSMDAFLAEVDRRLQDVDRELSELGDDAADEYADTVAELKQTRRRAARLRGRLENSVRADWSELKEDVAENLEAIDTKLERTWDDVTSS